jgi:lysyl-tRNA synthetase class 2
LRVDWRPGVDLAALQARAELLAAVRAFFAEAGVMEVETPLLAPAAGTDPAIEPLRSRFTGPGHADGLPLYLQTSPEYHMKRLLAAGSGPIYQIGKAFRDGEAGRRHNPEFTLLEWYRPGFDHHALMAEVAALVLRVLGRDLPVVRRSYRSLFQARYGIDPLSADSASLQAVALAEAVPGADQLVLERDGWLDLLLTHGIEAGLGRDELTFVTDYPASQAVLARLNPDDPRTAARFELYVDGLELANGFWELADADEQRARFEADRAQRAALGLPDIALDERLLAALAAGLPNCAGVALGLDRLLMCRLGTGSLDQVIAFTIDRA